MIETSQIIRMLGGEKAFGHKIKNTSELRTVVENGLRYRSLESVVERLDIPLDQALAAISLKSRTISRRKSQDVLKPEESNRVYRLARIATRAEAVFGEIEKARRWLISPNRALGGEVPLSLLGTDVGTEQVDAVLTRIEYGVYS